MYNPESLNLKVSSYSDSEAICICPFHRDTKPSASFNLFSGLFYCFSCGTAHNVKSLALALDGTIEIVPYYSPEKITKAAEKLWSKLLWNNLALDNDYLLSRNVDNDLVKHFQIRANENGVIFPITDHNKNLVGVQMRQYKRTPKYLTFGEKFPIWPMHTELANPEDNTHVMIVEGVFGSINLYRLGYNAYSVLGAMMKREINQYVFQSQVYGFFDNDFAGYVAGARLLKFIPRAKVIVPGAEVDNFSNASLTRALYNNEYTRYIPQLAELSGKKEDFYKYLPKG